MLRISADRTDMSKTRAAERLEELESTFAALSHATRRQILLVLEARGGELSAGEIAARFSCSWPTTSRHLKVLEKARLVSVSKTGRERIYRVEADRLRRVVGDWLAWFDAGD